MLSIDPKKLKGVVCDLSCGDLYMHVIYLGWVAEQGGEVVIQLHALEWSNHPF